MPTNITTLKSKNSSFVWINIVSAGREEISYLRKKYKFQETDLRDSYAKSNAQRPKFYTRSGYSFLILQFPLYNKTTRTVDAEEIDFFISENFIITCHKDNLPPLVELFNLCSADKFYREQYLSVDNLALFYEIIVRLQEYCFPIMDHISLDIKNIEGNIFNGRERQMVREILLIKRNILSFRRITEAHKNILQKLSRAKATYLAAGNVKNYYNDLIEYTKSIWDTLNGQKEMIEALEGTNTALISFKLNDIMRVLTVISVIILPLSLITGIFSMYSLNMPFVNTVSGFWIIIAVMMIIALCMFGYFKRKDWL